MLCPRPRLLLSRCISSRPFWVRRCTNAGRARGSSTTWERSRLRGSRHGKLVALLLVPDRHVGERDGTVVFSMACLSESLHTRLYDPLHRCPGGLQVVAGIELRRVFGEGLADSARRRQTQVGIDVDLPHAVLDALLDLSHRHAPRGLYVATVLVDYVDELFGHARGAVHDEVRGRKLLVDLLDDVHGEDLAVRLLGE